MKLVILDKQPGRLSNITEGSFNAILLPPLQERQAVKLPTMNFLPLIGFK